MIPPMERIIRRLRREELPSKEDGAEISPELALEADWQKQAHKMAKLFARKLHLTEKEYIADLPKFRPQPESFKGRFDIPVIVETRIPLKKLVKLAGLRQSRLTNFALAFTEEGGGIFHIGQIKDWEGNRFITPDIPYTAWLTDLRRLYRRGRSPAWVREFLAPDERGGTVYDGVALYLKDPAIINEDRFLACPGSKRIDDVEVPCFGIFGGKKTFDRVYDYESYKFRPGDIVNITAGREGGLLKAA